MDEINATILDAGLLAWLQAIGATNTDDTVTIEGWLPAWVPVDAFGSSVSAWVEGPTDVEGATSTRPITMTFASGTGVVFFSSYHTEDFFSENITPQDRILQYFVFEVL